MSSIGRVNVIVGLDGSEFRTGSRAMAGELRGLQTSIMAGGSGFRAYGREARAMFERNMTPLERYQRELSKVRLLHAAGAIGPELVGREMSRLATQYRDVIPPVGRFNRLIWEGRNALRSMAGASAGMRVGLGAAMGLPLTKLAIPAMAAIGAAQAARSAESFNRAMTSSLAIQPEVDAATRGRMQKAAFGAAFERPAFSAKEVAQGYYFLASAGLDAEQQIKALSVVTDFAQAGMFDLSKATDLLATAQAAVGLKSKDATQNMLAMRHVADILAKADTMATASIEQFAEALTHKAGTAMKVVGKDLEEGVAVLAAFADQGIKAEEAGTAFNIVLRDLQTKAISHAEAFRDWGVEVYRMGEMRNVADIVSDLEQALGGLSDEQRRGALMQMGFTDRSIAFSQALVGMSARIREYEKALRAADGFTKKVADAQLTPLAKGWGQVKNALTELAEAGLAGKINALGDALQHVAAGMRAWKAAGESDVAKAGGTVGVANRLLIWGAGGNAGVRQIAQDVAARAAFGSAAGGGKPAAGGIGRGGPGGLGPATPAQQALAAMRSQLDMMQRYRMSPDLTAIMSFLQTGPNNGQLREGLALIRAMSEEQRIAANFQAAEDALKSWRNELRQARGEVTARGLLVEGLAGQPGIGPAEIARLRAGAAAADREDQRLERIRRRDQLAEQFRSPREQFAAQVAELRQAVAMGMPMGAAGRALASYVGQFGQSLEVPQPRLAEAGTAEARAAILEHQTGRSQQMTRIMQEQLETLRRIAAQGQRPPVPMILQEVDF